MQQFLENHYFSFFMGMFLLVVLMELFMPRPSSTAKDGVRLVSNFSLGIFNKLVLFSLVPASVMMTVKGWYEVEWGLFALLALPWWIDMVLGVLLLDLFFYCVHRLYHHRV